ncbi:MAG: hemolysin family protein [Rubrobacter sp.]
MSGPVLDALLVVLALFLVALNGLFVAAEFGLVKIRSTQVDGLVREGRRSSGLLKKATDKLDAYLSVCQLGITISSLGLGALGEPAISSLLEPVLATAGLSEGLIHAIAFAVGFGIITFLHVVFGELAPKSVAIARAEGTSLFVAPFMRFFYLLFYPGVVVFNGVANAVVRLFGVPPASETEEEHSEEELRLIIGRSTRQGVLNTGEQGMLEGVFELEDTPAREVMVPRPDVVSLPAGIPLRELFAVVATGEHTRYPVHEEGRPDRIVGAVHAKDVMRAVEDAGGLRARTTAEDVMREVLTVPENRRVDDVLQDLKGHRLHMAIVIDEWGSFEGIVTMEDIVEEIVGEIRDEFDDEDPSVHENPDGSLSMGGGTPIEEANRALGVRFSSEDFSTMGGLVFGVLGRAPETGDEVRLNGYLLRVEEVDGPRVARVVARKEETEPS